LISLGIKGSHIHIKSTDADSSWNWRSPVHQHRGACVPSIITGITEEITTGNPTHSHVEKRVFDP
jgi:hypothetical protein